MAETEETKEKSAVPKTVWILGMVSLLMDISSEMIHALLPLFMVQTLNAGAFWIGLTEGGAEAIALFGKVFSGVIADRFKKRKILIFLGYGLGVASKPFLRWPTASSRWSELGLPTVSVRGFEVRRATLWWRT